MSESDTLTIAGLSGTTVLQSGLEELKTAWQRTLKEL